ncbi:ABC transporter ATP-binding protein [Natrarchaeobaculum sulfurireducens]|uniref:Molybdate/tungstate import ATP-binding protein WtpC n=1 Tax=Natrarchaeobaculum sulfurireducens TaxID=2044521 RepID=A0A346PQE1_9EURY|nr:ABC transporter ATP-binding protein [Natrarchaeobaculum sulfurireducens]AXR78243.1 ABC-type spermidine/putrescine transport system,ATPase component [Natrarchaeobaculum sulfurireducens]AXR81736.1 Putrescine transport ATP-binding protein PotA [Natrarchaeobaculum sulfurireducens]
MANGQLLSTTTQEPSRTPETTGGVVLELDDIGKHFGGEPVVSDLSLSVHDGEILTLLGPSGCGKTTTLRLIAGLEKPSAGQIRLDDNDVAGNGQFVPPEERGVGVVFQEFALFPHLTARENVAFGLQEWDDTERDARVEELLELVGLETHGDHLPDELSGGQQQRIALARSLAPEPEMLLLDEPFSNLDVDLRVEMREEVRRIIKETGVTAISVTHDQEEALSISDRVAVMNEGNIEQIDVPERVFQQPKSRFVAGFLGHASFLSGEVHGDHVTTSLGRVLRDDVNGLAHQYDGSEIDLLIRPDDVTAYPANDSEANGRVVYRRYLGPTVLYRVELDSGETIECMHNHSDRIKLDERVAVRVTADHELAWFPAGQRDRAIPPADD